MKILISLDLELYAAIKTNWPNAELHEANSLDGIIRSVFVTQYDLLVLDVDMPGNEKLDSFIKKAATYCRVVVFSSKNNHQQIKKMMYAGAHLFLYSSLSEAELANLLRQLY